MSHQFKTSEFNLSPVEVSALVSAAATTRDRVIIVMLAFTGIRRAELRDLQVTDLDFVRNRLTIRRGKGGKQRFVFFPASVAELVRGYLAGRDQGWLFPNALGRPLSLRSINLIVAQIGRLANIQNPNPRRKNICPHLLRHSLARNWKRAGGSIESLQKILGHASVQTTLDLYGTEGLSETESNYQLVAGALGSIPSIPSIRT